MQVVIPQWENYYIKSKKTNPKYWLWKDREKLPLKYKSILKSTPIIVLGKMYCSDNQNNRLLKNTNKAGKPNTWMLNGQDLYSGILDWRLRKNVAEYYHNYFRKYIKEQLTTIRIPSGKYLSISCDIYEIKRGNMPDVSNMWLLEKFFEDALQEEGIIEDDCPDIVLESGRKRYHWVINPEERQLIFNINFIT